MTVFTDKIYELCFCIKSVDHLSLFISRGVKFKFIGFEIYISLLREKARESFLNNLSTDLMFLKVLSYFQW